MKVINESLTPEQLEANKVKNAKIANDYAKSKGKESINDIIEEVRELNSSNNSVNKMKAQKIAQETITDLAQLILYQEIYETNIPSYMDLVDKTNDGYITNGNAKEYIADLITGNDTFVADMFNPTKQTVKKLEKYFLQMYDAGGVLNSKARQFKKSQTIQQVNYVPYFISGKLNDYLNTLRNSLYRAFKIFRFNHFCTMLTTTSPAKVIEGSAKNLFDSLVDEVIPNIEKLYQLNSEYAYQSSKHLYTSNPEDILIICSNKIKSMIKNGIKTQLFNAELLGAKGKTFTEDNIICLGNKLTMASEDEIIDDSKIEWVDDNTIYVLDISRVKSAFQVNTNASQFYASNLTTYIVSHVWYVMDILPWCKMFKYTNTNLSKLPE